VLWPLTIGIKDLATLPVVVNLGLRFRSESNGTELMLAIYLELVSIYYFVIIKIH